MSDIIDKLAGVAAGSPLDLARTGRPEARRSAQQSYELLLYPDNPGGHISILERRAVAAFVATLHGEVSVSEHYLELLTSAAPDKPSLVNTVLQEAQRGQTKGPYGHYPQGPLNREDEDGLAFQISDEAHRILEGRLSAALEHAHLLVFHPRDASKQALQHLLDAGWVTLGIVTLSQLIAFLTFQIRVVAGLKQIKQARETSPAVI